MGRRNRRQGDDTRPLSGGYAGRRSESDRQGDWLVQTVRGDGDRFYRCPGCDQEIRPGTPHIVAWLQHRGADDRRHWHTPCWNRRRK